MADFDPAFTNGATGQHTHSQYQNARPDVNAFGLQSCRNWRKWVPERESGVQRMSQGIHLAPRFQMGPRSCIESVTVDRLHGDACAGRDWRKYVGPAWEQGPFFWPEGHKK